MDSNLNYQIDSKHKLVPSDGGISVLVIPISLSLYIPVVLVPSVLDIINKRLL